MDTCRGKERVRESLVPFDSCTLPHPLLPGLSVMAVSRLAAAILACMLDGMVRADQLLDKQRALESQVFWANRDFKSEKGDGSQF
jgi:hypothetical protein